METFEVLITAVGTGASSAAVTIAALRIHIQYLRETVARQETTINRAHERIDGVEKEIAHMKGLAHR